MPPEQPIQNPENVPSSESKDSSFDRLHELAVLKEKVIAILTWLRKAPTEDDRKLRLESLEDVLETHFGSQQQLYEIANSLPHDLREEVYALARSDALIRRDILESGDIFEHAANYIGKSNARDIFLNAAEKNPGAALQYFANYKNEPYAKEVLEKAARGAAEHDTLNALMNFPAYKNEPYAQEVLEKAARIAVERDVIRALDYYQYYMKQPYAKILLSKAVHSASEKGLSIVLHRFNLYKNEPYAQKVLEKAARTAAEKEPYEALNSFDLYKNKPYAKEILEKAGATFAESLSPHKALYVVQFINQLHDLSDRLRFAVVARISAKATYDLIVLGDREVFTSSFNGLFNRLFLKVKSEYSKGYDINQLSIDPRVGTFIRLCASYNRLGEFLNMMNDSDQKKILNNFILEIDIAADPIAVATNVTDVLSVLRDKRLLANLGQILKEAYQKAEKTTKNSNFSLLYGLLVGMLSSSLPDPWFADMAKKYPLINPGYISSRELYNLNRENIQQHFFYNDKDGKASFQHFLDFYRQKKEWKIIEHEEYVVISRSMAGRRVIIYANKPDHEDDGPDTIQCEFDVKNIKPTVIVHRGHSYHTAPTIEHITSNAKIVSLGSCGGYQEVVGVLNQSPLSHIISTKGTGTMSINDPLFAMLNEVILSGKDIDWRNFWSMAKRKLGKDIRFSDYIAPHMNLSVLFLRAYMAGEKSK